MFVSKNPSGRDGVTHGSSSPGVIGTDACEELRPGIQAALERALAGSVRIGAVDRVSNPDRRNQLLRCHLTQAPPGAPATVMVKRRRPGDYDSDAHDAPATQGLYRDWAGLEFLSALSMELGGDIAGSPRFYAGDRAAGFVIMEDLGSARGLDDHLLNGTADEAERGLLMLAAALGRMHAATTGRESAYMRIRGALGPGDGPAARAANAAEVARAGESLADRCTAACVTPAPGLTQDVVAPAAAVADPGPFLAYTHGDPCPDNTVVSLSSRGYPTDALRLFDYEIGGYRHALWDGVYGRVRFPTCWCVRDLPEALVERMEVTYRAELVRGCPEAADDRLYTRALVQSCAAWVLTTLGRSLASALDADSEWGVATQRQRILLRLRVFADLSRRSGCLEALGETAGRLGEALGARWGTDPPPMDLYPAFTRGPAGDPSALPPP